MMRKRTNLHAAGSMCAMMLVAVLISGCTAGPVETEQPALIGLVKLDTNDELNIVNWTVDGALGGPKLGSFDWELRSQDAPSRVVWSGIAEQFNGMPDAPGVYYVDVNQNGSIDVGDTFRVKAPEDGAFALLWKHRTSGNTGEYHSHY